ATILGLAGVLLSWLPVLALLSLPLGGLGLLLGIAALVISIVQRGRGIPLALAGSLLSFATLIVAVLQLANAISFLRIGDPTNQSSVETVRSTTPSAISDQEKGAAQGAREPEWLDVRNGSVRLGDVGVKVISAVLGNVKIKNVLLGEETVSDRKYLCIRLEVQNLSKSHKLDFRGWSGADAGALNLGDLLGAAKNGKKVAENLAGAAVYAAILTDDAHNKYNRLKLDLGSEVAGQVQGEKSIYPGTSLEELLIFEPPVAGAQFLRLQLPGSAYGGTDSLRLQIPTNLIRK